MSCWGGLQKTQINSVSGSEGNSEDKPCKTGEWPSLGGQERLSTEVTAKQKSGGQERGGHAKAWR